MLQNGSWPVDPSPTLVRLTAEYHLLMPWTDEQLAWIAKVVVHIRNLEYELSHYCGDLPDPMDIVPWSDPSYGISFIRNSRTIASRRLLGLPGFSRQE